MRSAGSNVAIEWDDNANNKGERWPSMKIVTGIIIGMLMALNAHAGFIKQDWASEGDALVSVDTNTSLAWLSPSLFFGVQWAEVASRLDTDPLYRGFRFASTREYSHLLESMGNAGTCCTGRLSPIPVGTFIDHFGLFSATTTDTIGFLYGAPTFEPYAGPEGAYTINFSEVFLGARNNVLTILDIASPYLLSPDTGSYNFSYLLVRDVSEVTEPAPFLLMLLGLAAVVAGKAGSLRRVRAD